jgi:hypothetical protein
MALPGFNAETSLYKTSVHYRLMGASAQSDGITFQQFHLRIGNCGPCNWEPNLSGGWVCVRHCGFCILGGGCSHFTEPCDTCDPTLIPGEGPGGPRCPPGCVPDFAGTGACVCGPFGPGGSPQPI